MHTAGLQDLVADLDRLVDRSKVPGLQCVVVDAEGARLEYHGGVADLATGRPMLAETSMMAYSMSKTITAAAVLQLVEARRLGLDDAVCRHAKTPYGDAITVRQLLSHTAGLPNPIPLRWVHSLDEHARFDERASLDDVLRRHPRLASRPGTRFRYSNIGYWLLGRVVEAVTGEAFTSYVTRHILAPLGITPKEMAYVVPDAACHASGYLERYSFINVLSPFLIDAALVGERFDAWVHIRDHYPNGPAFGGLVGSASGLGKFLQDQLRPQSVLFGDRTRRLFTEQQRANGALVPMTLGWHLGGQVGDGVLFKEGGGGGFHGMMALHPSRGVGAVVMTNATTFDVRGLVGRVLLETVRGGP